MGKLDEMVELAKSSKDLEQLEGARLAKMGPSMSSYISGSGANTADLDADINRIKSQASPTLGRKFGKKFAGQVTGGGTGPGGSTSSAVPGGSTAGLNNEKSALIALDGTDYSNPALAPNKAAPYSPTAASHHVDMTPYRMANNVTDYRKITTNGARLLASRFT